MEYDPNGYVVAYGEVRLVYNQVGRFSKVWLTDDEEVSDTYYGMGRRIIKSQSKGSTVYHYDVEGKLIAESKPNCEVLKNYLWLDGELTAVCSEQGLLHTNLKHRHEPILVTGPDGDVTWQAISSPFGITETFQPKNQSSGNSTLNPRLTGRYCDDETAYHYNYMREYSPGLGRYLQAEPSGLNGGMYFSMPVTEEIQ